MASVFRRSVGGFPVPLGCSCFFGASIRYERPAGCDGGAGSVAAAGTTIPLVPGIIATGVMVGVGGSIVPGTGWVAGGVMGPMGLIGLIGPIGAAGAEMPG